MSKIFKTTFLICFTVFIILFISQKTGYTEYENGKRVALTNEQIEKFEQDVEEGKAIDVEEYLEVNTKDYQNKISSAGLKISKVTSSLIQKITDKSFKILSKLSQ